LSDQVTSQAAIFIAVSILFLLTALILNASLQSFGIDSNYFGVLGMLVAARLSMVLVLGK
jgi:hypothetical protein